MTLALPDLKTLMYLHCTSFPYRMSFVAVTTE
jgi:hypothetical protein